MKQVLQAMKDTNLDYIRLNDVAIFIPFTTTYNWGAKGSITKLLINNGVNMDDIELKRIDLLHAQGFIICQTAKIKAIIS